MRHIEKIIVLVLLATAFVLTGIKVRENYITNTKEAPGFGGSYKEAILGEVKFINPILANTNAEKSVSTLLFSSLYKFDKGGNAILDTANKLEISPDQLTYSVTLKDNIYFHDGELLTASDVVFTVQTIQDPVYKSPLYETWKDIKVDQTGANTVAFSLPKAYGPFIYALDFGILPFHLSSDDLSKTMVGSGPFKYETSKKNSDKISQLKLISNTNYYAGRPFINKLELNFFDNKELLLTGFNKGKGYQAISGVDGNISGLNEFSFPTSKKLVLVPNLRVERFKDKAFRAQILSSDQKLPEKVTINLATADAELQRNKADELKKSYAERNIELNITYYKPTEMKDVLDKKNYELLLFGFDFGHDRDPYLFWHSSQLDFMNYAGYSDKKSDILLEDSRMIGDRAQRNVKYDQFYEIIKSESLAVYYEPVNYIFQILDKIKGIEAIDRMDADSKYLGIGKWFIKETRVKK